MIGIDPGPFTLRELLLMAEAKSKEAWNHTSHLLAMLANVNRGRKSRAFRPAEFNPHARRATQEVVPKEKGNIRILKDVFVKPPK